MAVTPVLQQRTDVVLARLTQRRQAIETLIESVVHSAVTLTEVFERAGNSSSDVGLSADASVCRFVYLVKIVESLPGIGKVRARRVLANLQLGERSRVSDVTPAQRAALVKDLQ